jgi:hypothetical protein
LSQVLILFGISDGELACGIILAWSFSGSLSGGKRLTVVDFCVKKRAFAYYKTGFRVQYVHKLSALLKGARGGDTASRYLGLLRIWLKC